MSVSPDKGNSMMLFKTKATQIMSVTWYLPTKETQCLVFIFEPWDILNKGNKMKEKDFYSDLISPNEGHSMFGLILELQPVAFN